MLRLYVSDSRLFEGMQFLHFEGLELLQPLRGRHCCPSQRHDPPTRRQEVTTEPEYSNTALWYPSGRAVEDMVLRPLACWDCGFKSCWGHGYLSLVSVMLSGKGLCVGSITRPEVSYRALSECDLETSKMRRPQAHP
jgi:hypothetical protein